jgi:hypothetical protein
LRPLPIRTLQRAASASKLNSSLRAPLNCGDDCRPTRTTVVPATSEDVTTYLLDQDFDEFLHKEEIFRISHAPLDKPKNKPKKEEKKRPDNSV